MNHWTINLLALATSILALYFTLRLKKSYFLDSKFFLALANTGFVLVILQDIVSKVSDNPISMEVFTLLNGLMAGSVGFASFLLQRDQPGSGFRDLTGFLKHPPKTFILFEGIVVSWTIASVVAALILPETFQLVQTVEAEGTFFYYIGAPWWIVSSFILVMSYFLSPVLSLFRQSFRLKDAHVVRSVRILVFAWTMFGVMEFIRATPLSYTRFAHDSVAMANGLLFLLISFALREPTVFNRIIFAEQSAQQPLYSSYEGGIILYSGDSDRRSLLDEFAREQAALGGDIHCYVPKEDAPLYTAVFKTSSPSPKAAGGSVSIKTLESILQSHEDTSHEVGRNHRRELIDLGEIEFQKGKEVISTIAASSPDPSHIVRLWALCNAKSGNSLLNEIRKVDLHDRVFDMAGHQDSFSKQLEMDHPQLLGKRILVEYDPSSKFEDIALDFAQEFQANFEPVAVFTSVASPVYRRLKGNPNIRVFGGSGKTSTPLKVSEDEVLLPERDTSLLLDATDKQLQAYEGRPVGLVFDGFTDLVLYQGFDKTYGTLASVLEMVEIESATVLLLVNREALDSRALTGMRGLFRLQAVYDSDGLRPVRIPTDWSSRMEATALTS